MKLKHRRRYGSEGWAHSETYTGLGPAAFLHRARLRAILSTLRGLSLPTTGRFADFGCSDGFILARIREQLLSDPAWSLHGFDFKADMIELAEQRNIPNATFESVDLNHPVDPARWSGGFDVVTCFETFEHMGDYRSGVRNVAGACRPGGHFVIAVPNESGIPGLMKFYARKLFDKNPYKDVLADAETERAYVRSLLRGEDLEKFRQPARKGWGSHLGFDLRSFENVLRKELVEPGSFRMLPRRRSGFGFGRLFILTRAGTHPA